MIASVIRAKFNFSKVLITVPILLRSKAHLRKVFSALNILPQVTVRSHRGPLPLPLLSGLLFGAKNKQEPLETNKATMTEEATKKADEMIESKQFEELYAFMKEELAKPEQQVPEMYWRMAKACREMANATTDKEKKKAYTYEGLENSSTGVKKDENNFGCNKWQGIMLDLTARLEGTKKRIENSFLVKNHLEKAASINPKDPTIQHTLGVWCFEVADLGWLQKKLAATFFATPPSSSYEEALKHLEEAENIQPGFFLSNLVYLGKCYLRMGNKAKAKEVLQRCLDTENKDSGDADAKKEAADLIKKC